jgi:hypothetical protein
MKILLSWSVKQLMKFVLKKFDQEMIHTPKNETCNVIVYEEKYLPAKQLSNSESCISNPIHYDQFQDLKIILVIRLIIVVLLKMNIKIYINHILLLT